MADWTYRPGGGEALVEFHESDDPALGRPVATITWNGDEHLIPRVPSAYYDKIVCNLRNDQTAAVDLFGRVGSFLETIDQSNWNTLLAQSQDYDRLAIPGKGGMPLPAAAVQERVPGKPYASVRAKLVATDNVLGATTHFKPMLRGENPTVAELGFWALWDWMVLYLLGVEEFDALADSLNRFELQLRIYSEYGIPRMRDMGAVPFAAATAHDPDNE